LLLLNLRDDKITIQHRKEDLLNHSQMCHSAYTARDISTILAPAAACPLSKAPSRKIQYWEHDLIAYKGERLVRNRLYKGSESGPEDDGQEVEEIDLQKVINTSVHALKGLWISWVGLLLDFNVFRL
jgi:hypothetical protein